MKKPILPFAMKKHNKLIEYIVGALKFVGWKYYIYEFFMHHIICDKFTFRYEIKR